MELRNALLGYTPMLVAAGSMDDDAAGALQTALDELFEARHNIIFVDLTDVDQMSAGGVSVLVAAVQALRRGWLGVIGANADILGLLEAAGLLASPKVLVFENRQAAQVATGARAST